MRTIIGGIRSDVHGSHLIANAPDAGRLIRLSGQFCFSLTGTRGCPGYYRLDSSFTFTLVPCSAPLALREGRRCTRCEASDDSKLLHAAHKGREVPTLVSEYLAQQHWLYVAAFADGSVKIGTAAQSRKLERLLEQGASAAEFVGLFPDGASVRRVEESVSRIAGLSQSNSGARKVKGLLQPVPEEEIDRACSNAAALARSASDELQRLAISETWKAPPSELLRPSAGRSRLPLNSLRVRDTREWDVRATLGRIGLVRDSAPTAIVDYVFDFGSLVGQEIDTAPSPNLKDLDTLF